MLLYQQTINFKTKDTGLCSTPEANIMYVYCTSIKKQMNKGNGIEDEKATVLSTEAFVLLILFKTRFHNNQNRINKLFWAGGNPKRPF